MAVRFTPGVPKSLGSSAEHHPLPGALVQAFREITEAAGEPGDLLKLVTTRACRLLTVNRCAIYLLDESSGLYRGQAMRAGERFDDRVVRLVCGVEADDFTREILTTRRSVLIGDARTDPRPIRSAITELNVRTVLGVPMVLRGAVTGLLFVDDEGAAREFSDQTIQLAGDFASLAAIAVAQARTMVSLRDSFDAVAKQNTVLRSAVIAESRLAELALDGAGLDEIARAVAQLSSKPCAIYGPDGRRIGAGSPPGHPPSLGLLEPEDCARPEVADALAGLRPGMTGVIGPFRATGIAHRLLISPLTVREGEWGRVVIREQGSRFSALDAQVGRRAATIIALELAARRRATELYGPSTETLVRDLIGGLGDPANLARRARFHGLDVDDARIMCLVGDAQGQASRLPGPEAVAQTGAVPPGGLITAVPEGVAIVLEVQERSMSDPIGAAHAVAASILASMPDHSQCIVGLSNVFSGVAEFQHAYQEARQVTCCLRTFAAHRTSRILTAAELGAGCVFLASTNREAADRFVRQTLGPLVDLDDRSMRDLLGTLAVFLASSRSVRGTAERVGVHENTIRYRLARIAELSGLDVVTNVDHQLAGQLAILVLRLEGELPAPAPAPTISAVADEPAVNHPADIATA